MKRDYSLRACLLKYLKAKHTGHINAIPSRALEARFSVCGSTIRRAVLSLRLRGHPICSDMSGYFYAASSAELSATISQYEGRSRNAAIVKNALARTLEAMPDCGQQSL